MVMTLEYLNTSYVNYYQYQIETFRLQSPVMDLIFLKLNSFLPLAKVWLLFLFLKDQFSKSLDPNYIKKLAIFSLMRFDGFDYSIQYTLFGQKIRKMENIFPKNSELEIPQFGAH